MKIRRFLPLLAIAALSSSALCADRPNIFIAISDDQSWPHASAYGSEMVRTPAFDRVARDGVLFNNAFCASPGCSPSRAAFLTGLNTWQIEHAGTHASYFPTEYEVFPDRLEASGYFVGYTGKGWGPGNFKKSGRSRNPAGTQFKGSSYVDGFKGFLAKRPKENPFCFWFGSSDPHRGYKKESGLGKGMSLEQAEVPAFLPDTPEVRSDLLDYAFEIERFDDDVTKMLGMIEAAGEMENTLVIVTSDNGMPFPRAKANCYEYGIHMPLAISWKARIPGGRKIDDLVGFVDLTATLYEASGVAPPAPQVGRSILDMLISAKQGLVDPSRTAVYSARERHSSSRWNSLSYPQRCLRTTRHLYIRNFKPERWPAGPAQKFAKAGYDADNRLVRSQSGPEHGGYHDIDACPTLSFLIEKRGDPKVGPFLEAAVGKRPAEELYDIVNDPGCMRNLATLPRHAETRADLDKQLEDYLKKTGDARVTGNGDVWESYPRVSSLRWFPKPKWADEHPNSIPKNQPWVRPAAPEKMKPTVIAYLVLAGSALAQNWTESQTKNLPASEKPVRLFDGKTLEGWQGNTDYWTVIDGMIRGANKKAVASSTYLFTKKKYRNFRLLLEVKQTVSPKHSTMHSAVAALGEKIDDKGGNAFGFRGPLLMFCHDWGIWDAYRRNRIEPVGQKGTLKVEAEKKGDWNRIEILVTGDRIRFAANGALVFDFTDKPEMLKESPIGLQLHSNGRPQEFHFRGLVLAENPEDQLISLTQQES